MLQWDGNQPLIDDQKTLLDGSIDTHKIPKVETPLKKSKKKCRLARPTFNGIFLFPIFYIVLHMVTLQIKITKALY